MKTITYKQDDENRVGIIEINRPTQLNALNNQVINELSRKLTELETCLETRSIIITGHGDKAFVAGADIKEFKDFNRREAMRLSKKGKKSLFNKISQFSKPILSAINGYALGGGLELALASHIRVASATAKIGLPECSLGLIPGYSGTQKLTQIVGLNRAMEMILTATIISAEEGCQMGIINHVVSQEKVMSKCLEIARKFHGTSRESLAAAIKSINSAYLLNGDDVETEEFGKLFETEGFKEGVSAFLEKRKPDFNK